MLFMHVPANSALRRFSQLTGFRSAPKCKNPGAEIVPQTTPTLGNTHSNTFLSFYFAACDINTTHST